MDANSTSASAYVVMTALDGDSAAAALARQLVERRQAACVQRMPVRSTYRWKGNLEETAEVLLLVKTSADRLESCMATIQEEHPYELPEITALSIEAGLPGYLDWIDVETREQE